MDEIKKPKNPEASGGGEQEEGRSKEKEECGCPY
jgi:hypothetical protein